MTEVTRILSKLETGDSSASEELLPLVYEELKKLAAAKLTNEKTGHSLQPTVLVHDAYVRLVDVKKPQHWKSRGHFFGAAAEAMRRILVERARRKKSRRHGGDAVRIDIDVGDAFVAGPADDLLALNDALIRLEGEWPEKAKLVKLRYFAGLTIEEASRALDLSTATAERYWRFAKAWLLAELEKAEK